MAAHGHMLQLGRMTAGERVGSFLLDLAERLDRQKAIDLPMSRYDIADYLGLTIETVSRVWFTSIVNRPFCTSTWRTTPWIDCTFSLDDAVDP